MYIGKYLAEFGLREVEKIDNLCDESCYDDDADFQAGDMSEERWCEEGDLKAIRSARSKAFRTLGWSQ